MKRHLVSLVAVTLAVACGDQPLNDEPLVGPVVSTMPPANGQVNFAQNAPVASGGPSAAGAATGGFHAEGDLTVAGTVESTAGGFTFPDGTVQTSALPSGIIVMWSGTVVPGGWALCDGTNSTPNLIDRFILGTNVAGIGQTGGATDHAHTVDSHTHSHDHPSSASGRSSSDVFHDIGIHSSASINTPSVLHTHDVDLADIDSSAESPGTNTVDHTPPFYALAFIMKL